MCNVVVTGGSRGLGLGIAKALTSAGFSVIAIARSRSADLAEAMAGQRKLLFIEWDLSDLARLGELARTLRSSFGSIYGLVNNAGLGTSGILSTMPDSEIEQLVRMNILSPIILTKHLVVPMMAAREGRIVNISSIVATTGYPGLSVYSASKASLVGFTRSLAREIGSLGITVNAVAPGFVETGLTKSLSQAQTARIKKRSALQRVTTVEDVGSAVQFLMSDKAANITGTVITVDAGSTA